MDYTKYSELQIRWEATDSRLRQLGVKLRRRCEDNPSPAIFKLLLEALYAQGWVETNMLKTKPCKEDLYDVSKQRLQDMEESILHHFENHEALVSNMN